MTVPYYADDHVTLYLGDCLEMRAWARCDVLVTDPPYGIAWAAGSLNDKRATREASVQSIHGDQDTQARDDVLATWGNKPAIVFGTWRMPRPTRAAHRLIWHKAGRQPGVNPSAFYSNDEEIYILGTGWTGKPMQSVITTAEQRAKQPSIIGHPTPKPVGLMELLISKCPPGIIADPFAGSGATLIAARNIGRQAIGVEIDETYCEIIATRLSQQAFDFGDWEGTV